MDQLEEIKSKINIVDLISEYIPLKKTGRNFKALCPFHTEKTPSFIVSPERQIWHCFGCGQGGDIFSFVMQTEGIEFGDALRILAKKAGVEIKSQVPGVSQKKDRIYRMNKIAGALYEKILLETKTGQPVLDYLEKRQIKKETIEDFLIGFTPGENSTLVDFLSKKGFDQNEVLQAGLAIKRNGQTIDLFRNRLIFPFRNLHGDVVGFTGRILKTDVMPKYLNTAQTLIFDKSRILYDLSLAKEDIRKKDLAILVEGQMDVLSSYQLGVKNVICSSGTALTNYQIDLIRRFTNNIALAFDKDEAGLKAIKRNIDFLIEKEVDVQVILVPCGKDPDECIKKDPKSWQNAVKNPIPIMEFYFQNILEKIGRKPKNFNNSDKKKISKELLPEIKKIPDKIEQAFFIQKLAELLELDDQIIADALANLTDNKIEKYSLLPENKQKSLENDEKNLLEELIVGLILRFYKDIELILKNLELDASDFQDKNLAMIYKNLEAFLITEKSFNLGKFIKTLDNEASNKAELSLMSVDACYEGMESEGILQETEMLIKRLKKQNYTSQKKIIEKALKKAETEKNRNEIKKLMTEFKKIVDKEGKIV